MICPKCQTPMFIAEWDGWIWTCPMCDHQSREATDAEIEAQEKEFETALALHDPGSRDHKEKLCQKNTQ